jgi:hypothetical protein
MFGIFHKNTEKEFKLDTEKLPSLSEIESENNNNSINPLNETADQIQTNSYENTGISQTTFNQNNLNDNLLNQNSLNNNNVISQNNNDLKLELIESKISHLETISNLILSEQKRIDNKLNLILKILEMEISDETKNELKKENIMKDLQNRLNQ